MQIVFSSLIIIAIGGAMAFGPGGMVFAVGLWLTALMIIHYIEKVIKENKNA